MTIGEGILGLGICYLLANILTVVYAYFMNPKHNTPINEDRLRRVEEAIHDNGLDI